MLRFATLHFEPHISPNFTFCSTLCFAAHYILQLHILQPNFTFCSNLRFVVHFKETFSHVHLRAITLFWNFFCKSILLILFVFIYLFGVLRRFQHCTGHITTGSWKGRGNQYLQFVRVLYCNLPTDGKQLPAFPLEAVPRIKPRPQRCEARVLPLCHRGPSVCLFVYLFIYLGFYVAFNTVQVISRWVVGRAEETSTYSSSGFCTVNCQPTASNYQLSHFRPCRKILLNLQTNLNPYTGYFFLLIWKLLVYMCK